MYCVHQAWLNFNFWLWIRLLIFRCVFFVFFHAGSVPYWSRNVFVLYTCTFCVLSFTTSTLSPLSSSSFSSSKIFFSSFSCFSWRESKRGEKVNDTHYTIGLWVHSSMDLGVLKCSSRIPWNFSSKIFHFLSSRANASSFSIKKAMIPKRCRVFTGFDTPIFWAFRIVCSRQQASWVCLVLEGTSYKHQQFKILNV